MKTKQKDTQMRVTPSSRDRIKRIAKGLKWNIRNTLDHILDVYEGLVKK